MPRIDCVALGLDAQRTWLRNCFASVVVGPKDKSRFGYY